VNYFCRVGLNVVAAVVLAWPLTTVRLLAQKDVETTSPIVGAWTLDKKLSDVADIGRGVVGSTLARVAVARMAVAADSAGMDEAAGFPEAVVGMAVATAPIQRKLPEGRKPGETSLKHPIT
jgi:hypothetical protein